jgi:hypothetical protein
MTQQSLLDLVTQVVAQVLAARGQPAQGQPPEANGALPKATQAERLAHKDRALIAGFKRKGFADVVLMDRTDPSKPFNVKPFQAWIKEGRLVRKGEHGVRGLFHISQTEPVTAAPKEPKEGPKVVAKKPARARAAA